MPDASAADATTALPPIAVIPMTPYGDLGVALTALPVPESVVGDVEVARRQQAEIERLNRKADQYREKSIAPSTRGAYQSALRGYAKWCERLGYAPINGDPMIIRRYVAHIGERGLKDKTIEVHLAAIKKAHEWCGLPSPTEDKTVKTVVQGIRRDWKEAKAENRKMPRTSEDGATTIWNDPEDQKAEPVTLAMLKRMVAHCRTEKIDPATGLTLHDEDGAPVPDWAGLRDAGVLLLGFGMAARRSEVANLRVGDVKFDEQGRGVEVKIRFSKTDQAGAGQWVAVAHADDPAIDAPRAIRRWLDARRAHGLPTGADDPLFVRLKSNGFPDTKALGDESVADIVRKYVTVIATSHEPDDAHYRTLIARDYADPVNPGAPILDEAGNVKFFHRWSGHSLRAGFLSEGASRNASLASLKKQSRHASVVVLSGYIRSSELWKDNASETVFKGG